MRTQRLDGDTPDESAGLMAGFNELTEHVFRRLGRVVAKRGPKNRRRWVRIVVLFIVAVLGTLTLALLIGLGVARAAQPMTSIVPMSFNEHQELVATYEPAALRSRTAALTIPSDGETTTDDGTNKDPLPVVPQPAAPYQPPSAAQTPPNVQVEVLQCPKPGITDLTSWGPALGCTAFVGALAWYEILGWFFTDALPFNPMQDSFLAQYAWNFGLAIVVMTIALIINMARVHYRTNVGSVGGFGTIATQIANRWMDYVLALVLMSFTPYIVTIIETQIIRPLTEFILDQQTARLAEMKGVMSQDIGAALVSLNFIILGILAMVFIFIMFALAITLALRQLFLYLLIFDLCYMLAMTQADSRWQVMRRPLSRAAAVFLTEPLIAFVIWLGWWLLEQSNALTPQQQAEQEVLGQVVTDQPIGLHMYKLLLVIITFGAATVAWPILAKSFHFTGGEHVAPAGEGKSDLHRRDKLSPGLARAYGTQASLNAASSAQRRAGSAITAAPAIAKAPAIPGQAAALAGPAAPAVAVGVSAANTAVQAGTAAANAGVQSATAAAGNAASQTAGATTGRTGGSTTAGNGQQSGSGPTSGHNGPNSPPTANPVGTQFGAPGAPGTSTTSRPDQTTASTPRYNPPPPQPASYQQPRQAPPPGQPPIPPSGHTPPGMQWNPQGWKGNGNDTPPPRRPRNL